VLALAGLTVCTLLGAAMDRRPDRFRAGMLLRADNNSESRLAAQRSKASGVQTYQHIDQKGGVIAAEYKFTNFNNDTLRVTYSLPAAELAAYRRSYGYTDADMEGLKQLQEKALAEALQNAIKNRLTQKDLDKQSEAIIREYHLSREKLLKSRGFVRVRDNVYSADIPEIARRNIVRMRPVSQQLGGSASRLDYGSDEVISAALSLVQTAMHYENVPDIVDGRRSGGVYPPADALLRGKGDCDTKTALLASILLNWNRMNLIGLNVPNHYLMGILRNPAKGDVYIDYNGLRYVLLEPAGPAWLSPGMVGSDTKSILKTGMNIKIEPFTVN